MLLVAFFTALFILPRDSGARIVPFAASFVVGVAEVAGEDLRFAVVDGDEARAAEAACARARHPDACDSASVLHSLREGIASGGVAVTGTTDDLPLDSRSRRAQVRAAVLRRVADALRPPASDIALEESVLRAELHLPAPLELVEDLLQRGFVVNAVTRSDLLRQALAAQRAARGWSEARVHTELLDAMVMPGLVERASPTVAPDAADLVVFLGCALTPPLVVPTTYLQGALVRGLKPSFPSLTFSPCAHVSVAQEVAPLP